MSYIVIARKWRPQQFSDVLGQEHVTRTITNAIAAKRIAHAFLFAGPRGVGKTSAARILAKALCCESTGEPTPTPCGTCRQCLEITEGRSTDVFEIDAASHTGVDNVREIIDNVRYLPASARFKIYVIDEVHMLSTGAFNALLKTLEEPPAHVKFILATTDAHKVPVTILSRCQRYDFRRIALGEIAERLSAILEREGIGHDPKALHTLAREGEGSMRDAQSLLEQVLAFAGDRPLDGALIREALGVVDGALVDRAFIALLGRDPGALIELVTEVYGRGLDLKRFADSLVEEARDLLAARLVPDPGRVIDRPKDELAALVERAKRVDPVVLERIFDQLCRVVEETARASHPRFTLEVGLASIAEKPERVPVVGLLEKLERLEAQLASTPAQPGSPVRRPQDWRTKDKSAPYVSQAKVSSAPAGAPADPPPPVPPAREPAARAAEGAPVPPAREPAARAAEASPVPSASEPAARAAEGLPVPPAREPAARAAEAPPVPSASEPAARAAEGPPVPSAREAAPAPPAGRGGPTLSWVSFVELVKRRRPALAATLAQVRPLAFGPGGVELAAETAFDESKLKDQATRGYLEGLLAEHLGARPALAVVRGERGEQPAGSPETLTEADDRARAERRQVKQEQARARPAVQSVVDELGGKIAKVKVIDES